MKVQRDDDGAVVEVLTIAYGPARMTVLGVAARNDKIVVQMVTADGAGTSVLMTRDEAKRLSSVLDAATFQKRR